MFVKLLCSMAVIAAGMRSDQHKAEEIKMGKEVAHASESAKHLDLHHSYVESKLGANVSHASKAEHLLDPFKALTDGAEGIAEAAIKTIKTLLITSFKGSTCPKELEAIPDGYDYGVGCGFSDVGCKCPSIFDVCANAPRMGKVEDIQNLIARLSVQQLGYCRTGAWVFIMSTLLVTGALGGVGYFVYKKRS